ncbi:transcriptional regulator [Sphingomonas panacis]|uniref:Transcriptional regulator n=1 Tax=Sphingomonas panacis TaxID=1560345 RepID=A0A1B3Z750_9SPHN|nr:AlpA family phage regulatory protein [Sphingomonas panacis]AOH83261.1 transcriptional regulator [Sphingomonas panacis]
MTTETDPEAAQPPDRLLRLAEVRHRVGLGKTMIYRLIQEGKFPAPYKLSPFASRWSDREIAAWVNDVKDGFEGKRRQA